MNSLRSIYRFTALVLAFLMFFTSTGFAVDMHYCQGKLKSISFLGKAKTCHEIASKDNAPMKNCPHHAKMMAEKKGCSEDKNCCSNKTVHFQADQDQQVQNFDFVVSKQLQQFVIAYLEAFLNLDLHVEENAIPFAYYKPPLIKRDILTLNQSFLL